MSSQTPRDLGFHMPAEWEPHQRCWLAWPVREAIWGGHIEEARRVTAEIAQAIAAFEPVSIITEPENAADVSLLAKGANISVVSMTHDDSWTRDSGPTFITRADGILGGVDWRFNAWGQVYENYAQDALMARRILEHVGAERFEAPIVMEGGALHVDGAGTCLLCETSVLDQRRNPGLERTDIERVLRDYLAIEKFIWLPFGLVDDETSGHIDNLACFVRPGTILALSSDDPSDANYAGLETNLEILRGATTAGGQAIEVVTVPQPRAQLDEQGRRLTYSYINFYIANGGIVMPGFADPADTTAHKTLSGLFPDRRVVQIEVRDLLRGGGGIHCITQQQPALAT
ncbi:agmatine deiminase [Arboricoccus pini]|uniref:Putative agmatine deiminase n=1 Tax=Arboricoccus pini TaxID=1963835 RepID=A0A212S2G4_9PROT|nr:agmatine deiminase family protein [Arboricoccus pini]SNB79195.1 agmatine deiminase [Arboricoccus pini]